MDGYGEPRRSQWNVWTGFTIGGGMQVKAQGEELGYDRATLTEMPDFERAGISDAVRTGHSTLVTAAASNLMRSSSSANAAAATNSPTTNCHGSGHINVPVRTSPEMTATSAADDASTFRAWNSTCSCARAKSRERPDSRIPGLRTRVSAARPGRDRVGIFRTQGSTWRTRACKRRPRQLRA
jgi:hypothetical protein